MFLNQKHQSKSKKCIFYFFIFQILISYYITPPKYFLKYLFYIGLNILDIFVTLSFDNFDKSNDVKELRVPDKNFERTIYFELFSNYFRNIFERFRIIFEKFFHFESYFSNIRKYKSIFFEYSKNIQIYFRIFEKYLFRIFRKK